MRGIRIKEIEIRVRHAHVIHGHDGRRGRCHAGQVTQRGESTLRAEDPVVGVPAKGSELNVVEDDLAAADFAA